MAFAYAPPAEPMTDQADQDGFTVEEWLALPESRQRIELIDGSYVVSPTAMSNHQVCTKRLVRIFDDARSDDLEVIESINLICVDEVAIPDVVVGDAEVLTAATVAPAPGSIVLVAEVVSPGKKNRRRDFEHKPRMYAKAGIPTFLRVELTGKGAPRVEVLTLRDGTYEQTALVGAGETLHLKEPFEVSFDPAELAGVRPRTQS